MTAPPSEDDDLDATVARWIRGLRDGDSAAADGLWARYFRRLVDVADARIAPGLQRTYDSEDAALSAFHSMCRGVRGGRFDGLRRGDELWSLLVVITARKIQGRARAERTLKRGGGAGPAAELEALLDGEPTAEFALEVAEEAEHLMASLEPRLRPVAALKMEGRSNEEIATELGCALRTVERRLGLIRRSWAEEDSHGGA